MKHLKKLLKDKQGSSIIGTAGGILLISFVLAIAVAVAPIFNGVYLVDRVAHEVARFVEIKGDASYAQGEFTRLSTEKKLKNATMSINASGRIQLDDEFTVTVTYKPVIKVGTLLNVPLTFHRKATGRSEKYWK